MSKKARQFSVVLVVLTFFFLENRSSRAAQPIDLGSRRELMVDDYLIDRMEGGASLEMHHPTPQNIAIVHDAPWEGCGSGYHTVFKDGDKYRMYYKSWQITAVAPRESGDNRLVIGYAESEDGIHWTKPNLGLHEFNGSKDNNIVLTAVAGGQAHDFSVFRDENPKASPDARYKAVGMGRGGLAALKSPDGIHWTAYNDGKAVMTGHPFDTQNTAFWDPNIQKYRAYIRDFYAATEESPKRRGIMTSTSDDMIHWSPRQWLDYGDAPKEQLYINQIKPYYRAPHIYVGFPARYIERKWGESSKHLPGWDERQRRYAVSKRYGTASSDALLMTSRDGLHFKRWGEAFIRPGLRANNWAYGDNYIAWHVVETVSDAPGNPPELSLYATEDYFTGHDSKLRRYTLRLDGFVSLNAPLKGGSIVTKPFTFDGDSLSINYATSAAGSIRIELQDADGTPIPGFTAEQCDEIFGDQLDRTVTWQGESALNDLVGKPTRMMVRLQDADLYSFQFARADNATEEEDQMIEAALLLPPSKENPRNSEGDFVSLKDGRIMFVYTHFYGGGGDHAAAKLAARFSSDGGKTWTSEDKVILENEGGMNVMSVSLLRLKDGRIALLYARKNSIMNCRPILRYSRDEGQTWSDPIEIIPDKENGYYVLNNDRVIQTKAGRLIAPVAQHNGFEMNTGGKWADIGLISCYLSDDAGKTWRRGKESFYVKDPDGRTIVSQEPGVVELKDGRLMMFIRTMANHPYQCFSEDGGETWGKPEPMAVNSPRSPTSIERIPSTGDLLMVWNNNTQTGGPRPRSRTPLNTAVSKDEGKTWSSPRTLFDDPNGCYCYTAIDFHGKHVLLGHCAGGEGQGGMGASVTQVTRVPVDWLYQE